MPVMLMIVAASLHLVAAADRDAPPVRQLQVPDGGIQPLAAVGSDGTLHLVYYKGKPKSGDLYYVERKPGDEEFSEPIRVNSEPGTAVAAGTIRGAQIALGRAGRLHVAWNGAPPPAQGGDQEHGTHSECPMLYTRLDPEKGAFEPQRNLMTTTGVLDGGGAVAADQSGNVWVVWHGAPLGTKDHAESSRRVYVVASSDDGATFGPETAVDPQLGACACCGLAAGADARGVLSVLYRAAHDNVERDMVFLWAQKPDAPASLTIDRWKVPMCPMSSCAIVPAPAGAAIAWETRGQVYFARVSSEGKPGTPTPAPGPSSVRKHPRLAVGTGGETLLVWTERGGTAAWQVFDAEGKPVTGAGDRAEGLPAWSFVAAAALPDGSLVVIR